MAEASPAEWKSPADTSRYGRWGVLPLVDLDPGFVRDQSTVFTLELSGIGRENLTIKSVKVNDLELPESSWNRSGGQLEVTPGDDLREGFNRIMVAYLHPRLIHFHDGEKVVEHTFYVNFRPDSPRIELAPEGHLVINGKPLFIRGSFRSGQTDDFIRSLPSAAEAGFNMVHDYFFDTFDYGSKGVSIYLEQAKIYLDEAHRLGLGVFLALPRRAVDEFDEAVIAEIVAELSYHPALWLWYLYDEPKPDRNPPWNHGQAYRLIKRLDPERPVVVLPHFVETMVTYAAFSDLVWSDRYPITATGVAGIGLAPVAAYLQAFQQILADMGMNKPVWPVIQVHDNRNFAALRRNLGDVEKVTDSNHRPTEEEIRAQSHLSIASGSASLVYYWHPTNWSSMVRDTPGIWASFSKVLHEFKELESVLLLGERDTGVKVSKSGDKVMTWFRGYENAIYVGVVNMSVNHPDSAIIVLNEDMLAWEQIQGDGKATAVEEGILVELGGAGVAVIRIESE